MSGNPRGRGGDGGRGRGGGGYRGGGGANKGRTGGQSLAIRPAPAGGNPSDGQQTVQPGIYM